MGGGGGGGVGFGVGGAVDSLGAVAGVGVCVAVSADVDAAEEEEERLEEGVAGGGAAEPTSIVTPTSSFAAMASFVTTATTGRTVARILNVFRLGWLGRTAEFDQRRVSRSSGAELDVVRAQQRILGIGIILNVGTRSGRSDPLGLVESEPGPNREQAERPEDGRLRLLIRVNADPGNYRFDADDSVHGSVCFAQVVGKGGG